MNGVCVCVAVWRKGELLRRLCARGSCSPVCGVCIGCRISVCVADMLCCYEHVGVIDDGNVDKFVSCSKALGELIMSGCPANPSTAFEKLVEARGVDKNVKTIKKATTQKPPPTAGAVVAALREKYCECRLLFCGVIGDTASEHIEPVRTLRSLASYVVCVCVCVFECVRLHLSQQCVFTLGVRVFVILCM